MLRLGQFPQLAEIRAAKWTSNKRETQQYANLCMQHLPRYHVGIVLA